MQSISGGLSSESREIPRKVRAKPIITYEYLVIS